MQDRKGPERTHTARAVGLPDHLLRVDEAHLPREDRLAVRCRTRVLCEVGSTPSLCVGRGETTHLTGYLPGCAA